MGLERQDIVGLGMKEKWEKKGKTGEGLFHFFQIHGMKTETFHVPHTGA